VFIRRAREQFVYVSQISHESDSRIGNLTHQFWVIVHVFGKVANRAPRVRASLGRVALRSPFPGAFPVAVPGAFSGSFSGAPLGLPRIGQCTEEFGGFLGQAAHRLVGHRCSTRVFRPFRAVSIMTFSALRRNSPSIGIDNSTDSWYVTWVVASSVGV